MTDQQHNQEAEYLSLTEAAELCAYSQEYLSLRARSGKLHAVKLGRNWVTTREWLDEYVRNYSEKVDSLQQMKVIAGKLTSAIQSPAADSTTSHPPSLRGDGGIRKARHFIWQRPLFKFTFAGIGSAVAFTAFLSFTPGAAAHFAEFSDAVLGGTARAVAQAVRTSTEKAALTAKRIARGFSVAAVSVQQEVVQTADQLDVAVSAAAGSLTAAVETLNVPSIADAVEPTVQLAANSVSQTLNAISDFTRSAGEATTGALREVEQNVGQVLAVTLNRKSDYQAATADADHGRSFAEHFSSAVDQVWQAVQPGIAPERRVDDERVAGVSERRSLAQALGIVGADQSPSDAEETLTFWQKAKRLARQLAQRFTESLQRTETQIAQPTVPAAPVATVPPLNLPSATALPSNGSTAAPSAEPSSVGAPSGIAAQPTASPIGSGQPAPSSVRPSAPAVITAERQVSASQAIAAVQSTTLTLHKPLTVNAPATLQSATVQGSLTVGGGLLAVNPASFSAQIEGSPSALGQVAVGGDLQVAGGTSLQGLAVSGPASFTGPVSLPSVSKLTVTGPTILQGATTISNLESLTVNGFASVGLLDVGKSLSARFGSFTSLSTSGTFSASSISSGSGLAAGGDLTVSGSATLGDATGDTLTVAGAASLQSTLAVTGASSFTGATSTAGQATFTKNPADTTIGSASAYVNPAAADASEILLGVAVGGTAKFTVDAEGDTVVAGSLTAASIATPYAQTVTVAKSGGDYTSLTAALAAITDAATAKRYLIQVHPGTYDLAATVTLKDFVDIEGLGGPENVILSWDAPTAALVDASALSANTRIRNLTVRVTSDATGVTLVSSGAGAGVLENLKLSWAGAAASSTGVSVSTGSPTLVDVSITGAQDGVTVATGSPTIDRASITATRYAVDHTGDTGTTLVTRSTLNGTAADLRASGTAGTGVKSLFSRMLGAGTNLLAAAGTTIETSFDQYSSTSATGTISKIDFKRNATTPALTVEQQGTGSGVAVTQSGNGTAVSVSKTATGAGDALSITNAGTGLSASIAKSTADSTNAVNVTRTNATGGAAVSVTTNAGTALSTTDGTRTVALSDSTNAITASGNAAVTGQTTLGDGGTANYARFSSTGDLSFTGTADAVSGPGAGGFTIQNAAGALTIQTTTSGTLALTSAGAINLTGAAASTWDIGNNTLSLQTTGGGPITTGSGLVTIGGNLTVSGATTSVAATAINLTGSGPAIDLTTASTLSINTVTNRPITTGSGLVTLGGNLTVSGTSLTASSAALSVDSASVGGGYGSTGVSISNAGNIQANGTLTVDSTSTLTGQVNPNGGINADSGAFTVADTTGAVHTGSTLDVDSTSTFGDTIALDGTNRIFQSTSADLTLRTVTSGALNLTSAGGLTVTSGGAGGITLDSASGTITIASGDDIIPGNGGTNLGSAGVPFATVYADSVQASNLVGTVVSGSTSNNDWTINSDNATADAEDMNLAFERGTSTPNALITWDSTVKEFASNAGWHLTGTIASGTGLTLGGFTTDITTDAGEALVLQPAVTAVASATGGALTLAAGNASGLTSTGGSVNLNAGTGTSTDGSVNVGTTTAAAVNIAKAGTTTTVGGNLTVSGTSLTASSSALAVDSATIGGGYGSTGASISNTGNIQANGTLTVDSTSTLTGQVNANGGISADSGAFTVTDATGAVHTSSTLDVDSTSTFGDTIALDGSNRIIQSTSADLTVRTVTSGALNLTSAGALAITGAAPSTWDIGTNTLSLQTAGNGAITTGSGLFTTGGDLKVIGNDIQDSGGTSALTFDGSANTQTNGNLTVAANKNLTLAAGTGQLVVNSTVTNASLAGAVKITPSYTGGLADGLTYSAFQVDAFSPINAAGADSVNAVLVGNLTDPGSSITSTALNIGSGWDAALAVNGTTVINSTGQVPTGQLTGTIFTITDSVTPQAIASGDTLTFADGTDINVVTSATDTLTVNNTSTLATVTGRGATTTTLVNLDGGIAVDTSNFTVSGTTGAVTAVGINSGSGLLQGTGGLTVTGTTNINATGTAATNIGNSTGALAIASGGTSSWTNTAGNLTIQTATSGTVAIDSAGALNLGTTNSTSTSLGKAATTLTINPTAWTATPTISGLVTMTSGFDANAASNVSSLTLDANTGNALTVSGTSFATDIVLQNGETIDNDTDGTILLTATTSKTSGNLYVGSSGTGTITSGLINDQTISSAANFTGTVAVATSVTVPLLQSAANAATLTVNLPVSGVDAGAHTAALQLDGNAIISASATGDGAGGVGARTITIGASGDTININGGTAGTAAFNALTVTGNADLRGDLADSTGNLTLNDAVDVSGSLAANGGITFDSASDTVSAFTAAGAIDLNTNILTNIGNAGTDFVATTGALTLAGVLTANGGVTVAGGQNLTLSSGTGQLIVNSTITNASLAGAVKITPSYTGGLADGLTYTAFQVDAFSPTNALGADSVNAVLVGNLTDPGASITSTALSIGSGWDAVLTVSGTTVINSTGQVPTGQLTGTIFTITDSTTPQTIVSGDTLTFADGTDTDVVTSATDTVTVNNTSTLATVTGRGATTTTLVNLDGGIAVDTSNFTVSGTTGAAHTGSTLDVDSTSTFGDTIALDGSNRIIQSTSADLTVRTVTSGTLALTSAGALNLSAGAASTATLPNVANALNFDSNTLSIDALNNRVGVGTSGPTEYLTVYGSSTGIVDIGVLNANTSGRSGIRVGLSGSFNDQATFQVLNSAWAGGDPASSAIFIANSNLTGGLKFRTIASAPIIFETNSVARFRIDSGGNLWAGSSTDTSPDYLLELGAAVGSDSTFALSDDDVTHAVTGLAQTDVWAHLGPISSTAGGARLTGLSDADGSSAQPLEIRGVFGNSVDPTDTVPAVKIVGGKGATNNISDLGSAETVFQVANNDDTAALTVLGDGKVGVGDTSPDSPLEVLSTSTQLRLSYADGTDATFGVSSGGDLTVDGTGDDIALSDRTAVNFASSGTNGQIGLSVSGTFNPSGGGTFYGQKLLITNSPTVSTDTLYGNYLTFSDSGSLANTVTGLYVDATTANSADTTYAAVFQGGNVGIGTASPGVKLDIVGAIRANSGGDFRTASGEVYTYADRFDATVSAGGANWNMAVFNNGGAGIGTGANITIRTATLREIVSAEGTERFDIMSTGATPMLSINSVGNVGIATTGPDRRLDVLDASNPQLRLTQADGTVYADLQADSSGDLLLTLTGDELKVDDHLRFVTDNSYDVGASGATRPRTGYFGTSLIVGGTTTIDTDSVDFSAAGGITTGTGALTLAPVSGQNLNITLGGAGDLVVNTNQLYVDTSAARVGLGTASPLDILTVQGIGTQLGGTDFYRLASLVQDQTTYRGFYLGYDTNEQAGIISAAGTNGQIAFWNFNGAWSERVRINATGYLGIGDSSPDSPLEVLSTTTPQLRLSYADGSADATFAVSSAGALTIAPTAGQNLNFSLSTTGDLAVNTSQLYVDTSAARVGIGTTTPFVDYGTTSGDLASTNKGLHIGSLTSGDAGLLLIEGDTLSRILLTDRGAGVNEKVIHLKTDDGVTKFASITDTFGGTQVDNILAMVHSTGLVGIGTAGPDRRLDILDASSPQLRLTTTDGTVYTEFQNTTTSGLAITGSNLTSSSGSDLGVSVTRTFAADAGVGTNSAAPVFINLAPTVNLLATGGTNASGYTGIKFNVTETAVGSGNKYLADLQVGGTSKLKVDNSGLLTVVNSIYSGSVFINATTPQVANQNDTTTRVVFGYPTTGNLGVEGGGFGTERKVIIKTTSSNANIELTPHGTGSIVATSGVTSGTGTSAGLSVASSTVTSGALVDLTSTSTAAASNTQKVFNVSTSGTNGTAGQTTYGGYFANTHAGATSTNVALYASASGGTTANYAAIFESGNVGIGTTGPDRKLDVLDASNPQLRLTQADGTVYTDFQNTTTSGLAITGSNLTSSSGSDLGVSVTRTFAADAGVGTNSAAPVFINLAPTVNLAATGGTNSSGYTGIKLNVTETAIGSGAKSLIDLQVGSSSKFSVSNAGAVTAVGVNAGSGLIQGTGGLTVTGTANLNATGTAATSIGNATGALALASGGTSSWTNTAGDLTIQTATSGTVAIDSAGALNLGTTNSTSTSLGKAATTLTINPTAWTATPTISGLITATSGLTSNGALTVAGGQNLALSSGAGTFSQTYTGTGTAATITANSLTSGNILSLTSSSTDAAAGNTGLNIAISGANGTVGITRYGLQSAVTATNATSGTNVAAYLSASGATTANYGLIVAAGSVGIGDTTPDSPLEVLSTSTQLRLSYADGTDATFGADTSGDLTIATTGDEIKVDDHLRFVTDNNYDVGASGATRPRTGYFGTSLIVGGTTTIDTDSVDFSAAGGITTGTGALALAPVSGQNLNVTLGGAGDLAVNTNQLYVDTSAGNVGIGTAPSSLLHLVGSQPAAVASSPGTDATDALTITGGTGGNSTHATSGTGGTGADIAATGGAGGVATAATFTNNGGPGGTLALAGGAGGDSTVSSVAAVKNGGAGGALTFAGGIGGAVSNAGLGNTGGGGGYIEIAGGAGGAASGGTANAGGDGGDVHLIGGAAGSGGTGVDGDVLLGIDYGGTARGKVGIGDASPAALLTVGSGDLFQVSSAGLISTTPSSNSAALTLTGTNVSSANLAYLNSKNTSGTILNVAYGAAATLAGTLTGQAIDLSANVTNVAQSVTGLSVALPATTAASTTTHRALTISAGAFTTAAAATTSAWTGLDLTMPAITQGAGSTLTSTGIKITGGAVTSGTSYALTTSASAGNVGIGTATPTYRLDVVGTSPGQRIYASNAGGSASLTLEANGADDVASLTYTDGVGLRLGTIGAETLQIVTGDTERMYFLTTGEVGISDATPTGKRLSVIHSGAVTTTQYGASITNTTTSATASVDKYGLYVANSGAWGNATATNLYGLRVSSATSGGGTPTNNYGLYVDAPTGGTNEYAIYAATAASSDYALYTDTGRVRHVLGEDTNAFVVYNAVAESTIIRYDGNLGALILSETGVGNVGINDATPDALFDIDSAADTTTISGITATALTSGRALDIAATGNGYTTGNLISAALTQSAATGTSVSGDIASLAFSPTYSTAVTTPAITGQVLDVSRSVTTNASFASTLTVSGAVLAISNSGTQTTGTLTDTGNVLSLTQSYASASGAVLAISNSGTGSDVSGTSGTWTVSKAGAAVFVGLNSGSGLLQGTGGLTVTGTTNINATGTAATNIGNSTGALAVASGGTSSWTNTAGNLTIQTATSGTLAVDSAGALNLGTTSSTSTSLGKAATTLTINPTAWTATPTISGAVTMTSGFDANAASTASSLTLDANTGNALTISGTSFATDIVLQNGETIDNDADGTILLTATTSRTSGNLSVGTSDTGTITSGLINSQTISSAANFTGTVAVATSITNPLLIGGTGTTSTLTLRSTSGVGAAGADIIFQTGNNGATEAMRILNSGNVGIGTGAPGFPLEVVVPTASGVQIRSTVNTTGTTSELGFRTSTSEGISWSGVRANRTDTPSVGDADLRFFTTSIGATSEKVIISTTGNVGIGTLGPGRSLVVATSSAFNFSLLRSAANGILANAQGAGRLIFGSHETADNQERETAYITGITEEAWVDAANYGTGIAFSVTANGGTTVTEKVRISNAGNVGIGDATPTAVLDIAPGTARSGSSGTTNGWFSIQAGTYTDSATAGSGTAASYAFNSFATPTLAATNASVTTTDAANVYIGAAPTAGTNTTLTRAWAQWIDSGNARFDGNVMIGGGDVQAPQNALHVQAQDAVTNASTRVLRLEHTTSGTAAANFATGVVSFLEDASGNSNKAGFFDFGWDDATDGSEDSFFQIGLTTGGVTDTTVLKLTSTGNLGIGDSTPTEATLVVGSAGAGNIYATFAEANSERLCWDASGASLITDCTGTPGDYAEDYGTADATIGAGDVVISDPARSASHVEKDGERGSRAWIVKSSSAYQGSVIGIVSTDPNEVIGQNFTPEENPRPVALNGRVPIKVTDENGFIRRGDLLVTSSTPGHSMRHDPTKIPAERRRLGGTVTILGIALEDQVTSPAQIIVFIGRSEITFSPETVITVADGSSKTFREYQNVLVKDEARFEGKITVVEAEFTGKVLVKGEATFEKPIYLSKSSAGELVFSKDEISKNVTFETAYSQLPVVTTGVEVLDDESETWDGRLRLRDKSVNGFTVKLSKSPCDGVADLTACTRAVVVNWVAVGQIAVDPASLDARTAAELRAQQVVQQQSQTTSVPSDTSTAQTATDSQVLGVADTATTSSGTTNGDSTTTTTTTATTDTVTTTEPSVTTDTTVTATEPTAPTDTTSTDTTSATTSTDTTISTDSSSATSEPVATDTTAAADSTAPSL